MFWSPKLFLEMAFTSKLSNPIVRIRKPNFSKKYEIFKKIWIFQKKIKFFKKTWKFQKIIEKIIKVWDFQKKFKFWKKMKFSKKLEKIQNFQKKSDFFLNWNFQKIELMIFFNLLVFLRFLWKFWNLLMASSRGATF